jgi:hypothetical protein
MRLPLRIALVLLLITYSAFGNAAEPFNAPHLLPPSSLWVFSITDVPQTWTLIKATPIYREYQALLANPAVTNSVRYKELELSRRKLELAAGFPLSLDTIAGLMVSGIDLAVMPPSSPGAPLNLLTVVEVRDMAKVQKLLSALEQQSAPAGQSSGSPTPTPTPQPPTYKSVPIHTMPGTELVYAFVDKYLILSNNGTLIRETIDRTKGELKTTLTSSPDFAPLFAKAMEGLNSKGRDLFYVVNYSEVGKTLMKMIPGVPMILGSSAMQMGFNSCVVGDVSVHTDHITFSSYMPFTATQSDLKQELFRKYPPTSLSSLRYIPQGTLFCSASNLLDGPVFYDTLYKSYALVTSMGGFASSQNTQAELDAKIADLENTLGFKLKEDLAASLGPEYCIAINRVSFPAFFLIPAIDMSCIVQVKDRAKMTMIMQKLEQWIQKSMQAQPAMGQPSAPQSVIQSTSHNGVTIRSLVLPNLPSYSPCYAFDGSFLLIETSVENMKNLLNVKGGASPGMTQDAEFQRIMQQLPEKHNQFEYVAIANVVSMIKTIATGQLGATSPDETGLFVAILDALTSLRSLAVSNGSDVSGVRSQGILLMK